VIDDNGEAKCKSCGGEGFVERLKGLFFAVVELFDWNVEPETGSGELPVLSHR
jgi:hypothetical protein